MFNKYSRTRYSMTGTLILNMTQPKKLEQRYFISRNDKYVQQVFQDQMLHENTA